MARLTVEAEDLQRLEVIHGILALLRDPAASAQALAHLVDELPVLHDRLEARYHGRAGRAPSSTVQLVVQLGNRAFEGVLLELLEDLTVLHADLES